MSGNLLSGAGVLQPARPSIAPALGPPPRAPPAPLPQSQPLQSRLHWLTLPSQQGGDTTPTMAVERSFKESSRDFPQLWDQ